MFCVIYMCLVCIFIGGVFYYYFCNRETIKSKHNSKQQQNNTQFEKWFMNFWFNLSLSLSPNLSRCHPIHIGGLFVSACFCSSVCIYTLWTTKSWQIMTNQSGNIIESHTHNTIYINEFKHRMNNWIDDVSEFCISKIEFSFNWCWWLRLDYG